MALSGLAMLPLAAGADAGHACAGIAADAERLACYDAAFGDPALAREPGVEPALAGPSSTVSASGAAIVPSAGASDAAAPLVIASGGTEAAAIRATTLPPASTKAAAGAVSAVEPEGAFGFNEMEKRQKAPEIVPQQPAKLESIESIATIVSSRRTGEFVYTLANGQVWIQTEASQDGYLRDGSAVRIKRAALGSYKLISGSVSTRVRRVQ